jgi:hypothetical protein
VLRTWLPKELFVPEGRLVGIDFVADDLVRESISAEFRELLSALPETEGVAAAEDLGVAVRQALVEQRDAGREPSLVLTPISWRALEALQLEPIPATTVDDLGENLAKTIEGMVDAVPVLDTPLLDDRIWIVDLRAAVRWEEWPSDEDSGLTMEIRFFDRAAAEQLLVDHPEAREADRTEDQNIQDIGTKALLELGLCFRAVPSASDAAVAVLVPEPLRR